jgi:hypothetical protein
MTMLGTTETLLFDDIKISGNRMNLKLDGNKAVLTRVE